MRQQINLYQDSLIDRPQPLNLKQVGFLFVLLCGLLSVISLYDFWTLNASLEELTSLQSQRDLLSAEVVQLSEQYPAPQKDAQLEADIATAEQKLAAQNQMLGYFSSRDEQINASILDILDGLARHRLEGLWLEKIHLAAGGNDILLSGAALTPEHIPLYLQTLASADVLDGQVFSRLKLARLSERPGQVTFSLESVSGEY
ncbi:MAG: hypothetical protein C0618_12370 [Desulfuromonas sp.]|nr:MAG: hypothetical protein C0618_12370 [Desulfuromonas sp.]